MDSLVEKSEIRLVNKLWKFHWNCGRSGDLYGVFIATEEEVQSLVGKEVYFGEVLGKHSEVYGTIEQGEITLITDNTEAVKALQEACGTTISGYNPLHYLRGQDE